VAKKNKDSLTMPIGTRLPTDDLLTVLADYKSVLLDLNGVVWRVDYNPATGERRFHPFAGIAEKLAAITTAGLRIGLLSNRYILVDETKRLLADLAGIHQGTHYHEVMTSAQAMADFALAHKGQSFIPLGPRPPTQLMIDAGWECLDDFDPRSIPDHTWIVCSGDYGDQQQTKQAAQGLITRYHLGYRMIFLNPEVGAKSGDFYGFNPLKILGQHGIDTAADQEVGRLVAFGKPYRPFYHTAMAAFGFEPNATIAIGDSALKDGGGAFAHGMPWILINPDHLKEKPEEQEALKLYPPKASFASL
jgi:ribonucleotide monophosphatase NagD (HAD superfamily)